MFYHSSIRINQYRKLVQGVGLSLINLSVWFVSLWN